MKLSNAILSSLMVVAASASAQVDTIAHDSIQIDPDNELQIRSERGSSTYFYIDGIKIQSEQTFGPAGEPITIEITRRRTCYACGRG